MRFIHKNLDGDAAKCLKEFIEAQMKGRAEGISWKVLRVDYPSFNDTAKLRSLLISEQKGLCAYTGTGLDQRLPLRSPSLLSPPEHGYSFRPHIEHIKSQQQCKLELQNSGMTVGKDCGEDIAYTNLVAALEIIGGKEDERFGAAYRGNNPLQVIPTDRACETVFIYLESGNIAGSNSAANATITTLRLDHPSLVEWRKGAIRGLLPQGQDTSREDLQSLINALENQRDNLPEFPFVILQIARAYLAMK